MKAILNKHFIISCVIAILLILTASFGVGMKKSNAMLGFEGKIVSVTFCPCSFNLLISIAGVKGGIFSFEPGSVPFAWYQIFHSGPWTKGSYVPGNVCLWYVVVGCAGIPTMGTILDVGTSL